MNQGIYGVGAAAIANMPYGVNGIPLPSIISVLVVGGGGGGGGGVGSGNPNYRGAAGGAGGFIESSFIVSLGNSYTITIGAGGSGSFATGLKGGDSLFATFTAVGGGGGGGYYYSANGNTPSYWNSSMGGIGGSGGGAGITGGMTTANSTGGRAILGQGNVGGSGFGSSFFVGGAGGAGSAGGNASSGGHGTAGIGKASTLNNITYAAGGSLASGSNASANTGNGGNNNRATTFSGTNGGSGIIVVRFNNALNIRLGVGLTYTSITSGSDRIITITAGTDTVTFF
jgi:hypothetical protein